MKRLVLLALLAAGCTTGERAFLADRITEEPVTSTLAIAGNCETFTVTSDGFPSDAFLMVGIGPYPPAGVTLKPSQTFTVGPHAPWGGSYGYSVTVRTSVEGDDLDERFGVITC